MKNDTKNLATAAVACLMALSVSPPAVSAPSTSHSDYIKCYGVAAANKNDCGTVISACGASIAEPGACYAWIFTPKEICAKLANGNPGCPAPNCKAPTMPTAAAKK